MADCSSPRSSRDKSANSIDGYPVVVLLTRAASAPSASTREDVVGVERTCTDPGGQPASCSEPTAVSVSRPRPSRSRVASRQATRSTQRPRRRRKRRRLLHRWRRVLRWAEWRCEEPRRRSSHQRRDAQSRRAIVYVTNGNAIVAFDILPDGGVTNRRNFATLEAAAMATAWRSTMWDGSMSRRHQACRFSARKASISV